MYTEDCRGKTAWDYVEELAERIDRRAVEREAAKEYRRDAKERIDLLMSDPEEYERKYGPFPRDYTHGMAIADQIVHRTHVTYAMNRHYVENSRGNGDGYYVQQ